MKKIELVVLKEPQAIKSCPGCGGTHHAVDTEVRDGQEVCVAVTCSDCGLDILQVHRWLKDLKRR